MNGNYVPSAIVLAILAVLLLHDGKGYLLSWSTIAGIVSLIGMIWALYLVFRKSRRA